jgi:hypothetical protein
VEQPLSCSVLEDTRARAPMKIMMTGSPEDIYLFACSLQSLSSGHVAALELPELEGGYRSPGATQRGGESRYLNLMIVHGDKPLFFICSFTL